MTKNRQMIKLITFDLDNTLWNATPVLINAENILYEWLQANTPKLSDKHSIESMHQFKGEVAKRNPDLIHSVSALRLEALKLSFQDAGYNLEHAELHAQKAFDVFKMDNKFIYLLAENEQDILSIVTTGWQNISLGDK